MLLPETTSRILFLVDLVDGREPLTEPLDHLAAIASKYGERPASWVRLGDPGAPDVELDRMGRLRCPSGPLDPETSYVLIRYVGDAGRGMFGRTAPLKMAPECGDRAILSIDIAQDTLARHRFLWLTRRSLEENDLVHEYGHVLGLGSNPSHGFYPDYPDLASGDHCVNPDCALASPRARASLYRFYRTGLTFRYNRDFCAQCRLDIEQAKRHWRTGEEFPATPLLPQPDLSRWIAKLKDADFKEDGKATILLYHGKEVMPPLMKRMLTLPTGGEDSPRAIADYIAKAIVTREAVKRAGGGYAANWKMTDESRQMLWWWMKEGRRFMAGDQWELPPVVSVVPKGAPDEEEAPSRPAGDPAPAPAIVN
jgi:hypothetical protein